MSGPTEQETKQIAAVALWLAKDLLAGNGYGVAMGGATLALVMEDMVKRYGADAMNAWDASADVKGGMGGLVDRHALQGAALLKYLRASLAAGLDVTEKEPRL